MEEAIYQTIGQTSPLVGVPDVTVQKAKGVTTLTPQRSTQNETSVSILTQPIVVDLPMPEVIRQGYLEIRDVSTGEVITVIEVLSPVNKRPGAGRQRYEAKRQTVLASATHLVEIDLLRQWSPIIQLPDDLQTHYRILVSASANRPQASLYAFNLVEPIPAFPLPLNLPDPEPIINIQQHLNDIYDQSGYDLVIDYTSDPIPALAKEDGIWLDQWLQQQGIR